jgi:hypothetical protein
LKAHNDRRLRIICHPDKATGEEQKKLFDAISKECGFAEGKWYESLREPNEARLDQPFVSERRSLAWRPSESDPVLSGQDAPPSSAPDVWYTGTTWPNAEQARRRPTVLADRTTTPNFPREIAGGYNVPVMEYKTALGASAEARAYHRAVNGLESTSDELWIERLDEIVASLLSVIREDYDVDVTNLTLVDKLNLYESLRRQCFNLVTISRDRLWTDLVVTSLHCPKVKEAARGLPLGGVDPSGLTPPDITKARDIRKQIGLVITDSVGMIYRDNKEASSPAHDLNSATSGAWGETTFVVKRGAGAREAAQAMREFKQKHADLLIPCKVTNEPRFPADVTCTIL